MRLKKKLVEEVPEEGAGGKPESALEVRDEDDIFSFLADPVGSRCRVRDRRPRPGSGVTGSASRCRLD